MSDKVFAVQFKNIHTDVYSLAIFSARSKAQWFFEYLDDNADLPEMDLLGVHLSSLIEIKEIDARKAPDVYPFGDYDEGTPLEYCNLPFNNIPAIYN